MARRRQPKNIVPMPSSPTTTMGTSRAGTRACSCGIVTDMPCTPMAVASASSGLSPAAPAGGAWPAAGPPRGCCCGRFGAACCEAPPLRFAMARGSLSCTTSPSMISTMHKQGRADSQQRAQPKRDCETRARRPGGCTPCCTVTTGTGTGTCEPDPTDAPHAKTSHMS